MDDDGDDKDDTKRRTRNLSEKKRRDQFNMLVHELSTLVSSTNRKMDKSTVLKSTISFLKNHNEVTVKSRAHDVQEDWKPAFLSNEEFTFLVLEALEGFFMVFSETGQICYVSESISLLGHNPADIINKSIFELTYEDDRPNLYSLMQNSETVNQSSGSEASMGKENVIRFQCHVRRGTLDFREAAAYELVQFYGHFRSNVDQLLDPDDNMSGYQQDHESSRLFICTGRLCTPQLIRDVSLVDSNQSEFTSRYSLEWKFLFLDHRAPPIIGYLPFEVLGTSGYDYYHFDDLEKVIACHEELMQKGELTSCYYRFLTKGQQWIWLQTRFFISYHQWNSKPEFVVCNHRVVSNSDVMKISTKQEQPDVDTVDESKVDPGIQNEGPPEENLPPRTREPSPTYISETGEGYSSTYRPLSRPASLKSVSVSSTVGTVASNATGATVNASWPRASHCHYQATGSDTASLSGESRSSQRNSEHRHFTMPYASQFYGQCHGSMMIPQTPKGSETLVPQHTIGAQYLDPVPYVSAVGVPAVLPLTSLPVIVAQDQAQMQEQLQRKHEELQQMIVRQQEELRQVKEQLLLARLGILQPLINVPSTYVIQEEVEERPRLPSQIIYDGNQRSITGYPPPPQPPHNPNHYPHNMPQ